MVTTVRLYSRQNDKILKMLENKHRIINNPLYVRLHLGPDADLFLDAYYWFTEEASKLCPKPEDVKAPIWCSISESYCMRPIPGTVVYVLEVPTDQVIYFDNLRWDYVLNRIYIPQDEADQAAYDKHIKDLGLSSPWDFFNKYPGLYPAEEDKIRQSWLRCFEVDINKLSPYQHSGNLWEIREEWVKKIVYPGQPIPKDDELL